MEDGANLGLAPGAVGSKEDLLAERAVERQAPGIAAERLDVRADRAGVAARDGPGEALPENCERRRPPSRARRGRRAFPARRPRGFRPPPSRGPRSRRRRRRRRPPGSREAWYSARLPGASRYGRAPTADAMASASSTARGWPSTATNAPLQSSSGAPVKGRTGCSEATSAPARANGARTSLPRAPERCRAKRQGSRGASSAATGAIASSGTASTTTSHGAYALSRGSRRITVAMLSTRPGPRPRERASGSSRPDQRDAALREVLRRSSRESSLPPTASGAVVLLSLALPRRDC